MAVLSLNSARSSSLRNADLTSNIINQLPARIKILILAPDREAFTVVSNPWKDRVRFIDMPEKYTLTIWPQDPFVVLHHAGGTRLLAAPEFARADDTQMAHALSTHLDLPIDYTSLAFEGGNIVADEEYVFIGANTIRLNAIEQNLPDKEIAKIFKRELGRPVIVVGPVPQPVGHIDMMLTPLGEHKLMLADPAWGARLAAQELAENPDAVAAFEKRCEQNFFGHADIEQLQTIDGETIRPPEIVGATGFAIDDSNAIAAAMDGVAEKLEQLGFDVARVPFLYRKPDLSAVIAAGETIPGKPDYPQITYNNVLLETINGEKTVYLPAYGWAALDTAAAEAWRAQGYTVVIIPGFTTTAMYGGALRC
ncbi:MAG: agmatine deiminase family protein, partial [Gammaproteobacteria bacterium]|nr:agmatine deiminase family protein [Gammaproteobacteria bacterium]